MFQGFFVYDADAHVMVSQRIVRDNAAEEIFENKELSDSQKRKILSDNGARYYGEP